MSEKDMDQVVRDLTLMLLYLTSWEEEGIDEEYHRAWKGYPFEVLDQLRDEEELISGSNRSKSVYMGKEAVEEAQRLLERYGMSE
ncbi:DUF6429 family protein [Virgibacillus halodenitrificans]|uniref:DUF6429 family protein n=1 Tax=Virgibacillus halodenitrificans TaxID=1482 RepID=UPI001FB3517C|nr:DUF6429 family protein [Virgibacillus halodenitrificans]MCJ0931524.1 DUF6429 family protein [Virgibacillus halodenitrificans]